MMVIRSILLLVAIMAMITGCVTPPPAPQTLGNFFPVSVDQSSLALDVAKQLEKLNSPAKTKLIFKHSIDDPFGIIFSKALRDIGFAVQEFSPESDGDKSTQGAIGAITLSYLLTDTGADNVYRVTVSIGSKAINRAYVLQAGSLSPAGAWVRKD